VLSDGEKIKTLDIILEKLKQRELIGKYDIIGLIGGEFFQGQLKNPEVRNRFFEVFNRVNDLMSLGAVKQLWVTATLICQDQTDLFDCLSRISDKSKIWICTSYDVAGRFHTEKARDDWMTNMKRLKTEHPGLNLNTTSILTGSFVESYMSGDFSLSDFRREFKTSWFSKPPNIPVRCKMSKLEFNTNVLPGFFPERQKFLSFLYKFRHTESEFDYDNRLFSNKLRADELVQPNITDSDSRSIMVRNKLTDEEYEVVVSNQLFHDKVDDFSRPVQSATAKCVHNGMYTPYVDSDACFYCDKEMIRNIC